MLVNVKCAGLFCYVMVCQWFQWFWYFNGIKRKVPQVLWHHWLGCRKDPICRKHEYWYATGTVVIWLQLGATIVTSTHHSAKSRMMWLSDYSAIIHVDVETDHLINAFGNNSRVKQKLMSIQVWPTECRQYSMMNMLSYLIIHQTHKTV